MLLKLQMHNLWHFVSLQIIYSNEILPLHSIILSLLSAYETGALLIVYSLTLQFHGLL